MRPGISQRRAVLLGISAVVAFVLAWTGAIASCSGDFIASTQVYLYSDRAGLLMEPGSDVKVRGVVVGRVSAVDFDNDRAKLTLDLTPVQAQRIPANVGAELASTTLFGRKFVTLVWPDVPASTMLSAGSVIDGSKVPVEVNDTFDALLAVLETIEPQKVNATLTALGTALDGHGGRFGDLMVTTDRYLAQFNDAIPTLQRDIPLLADNLDTFAAATPDFMNTIRNLSTTGTTIVEKQVSLSAFLLSFTTFGNTGEAFVDASSTPLIGAVEALEPTLRVLAEQSPSFPCFLSALNQDRKFLERALGGGRPGLNILSTLLLGDAPYSYPKDLPVNGANDAPSCYGYPYTQDSPPVGHTHFNTGTTVYGPIRGPEDLLGNPFSALIYGLTR
ncbi:MCE family protein [Nocardia rhizosphaerihabitans]|uniref:MCE family protein n=1 Tax=Nocardia rhizosphaerihabitans TaxID=1691570 RepID=UPI0036710EA0